MMLMTRNKFMLFVVPVLLIANLLSGCASLNGDFECPLPKGIHCKSLDEVNSLVDAGLLAASDVNFTNQQTT